MTQKAKVKEIILNIIEMEEDEINDEDLFSEHGVDSLTALDILTELEREFRFKLSENVLREFTTINGIVSVVDTALAEKAG